MQLVDGAQFLKTIILFLLSVFFALSSSPTPVMF